MAILEETSILAALGIGGQMRVYSSNFAGPGSSHEFRFSIYFSEKGFCICCDFAVSAWQEHGREDRKQMENEGELLGWYHGIAGSRGNG